MFIKTYNVLMLTILLNSNVYRKNKVPYIIKGDDIYRSIRLSFKSRIVLTAYLALYLYIIVYLMNQYCILLYIIVYYCIFNEYILLNQIQNFMRFISPSFCSFFFFAPR